MAESKQGHARGVKRGCLRDGRPLLHDQFGSGNRTDHSGESNESHVQGCGPLKLAVYGHDME